MLAKNKSQFFFDQRFDHAAITNLAAGKSTPFYLYSEKRIRQNIRALQEAARPHFPDFRLQFAIKANSNPSVLKIAVEEGVGADCSSPVEMKLAKKVGFDMAKSTYTGNFESREDFQVALDCGAVMNLDDHARLEDLASLGLPEVLSIRINPGVGRGSHAGVVTGGHDAKFGIPHEKTAEAYRRARDLGVKRFGIHMMTGSNILDATYFAEITELLFDIIEKHIAPLGIKLDFINIGGGLGVPYREENALDLSALFSGVRRIFDKRLSGLGVGKPALAMEPGRYLVADAGLVISKVHHVKESYKNFVGIDGGMTTMLRPAMYESYHNVRLLPDRQGEAKDYWICGQICENTDVYPYPYKFVSPKAGDLVAIENAGAYGHVMANTYNHRPRPAEYLVRENGDCLLIREAETEEDLFRHYPGF